MYKLTAIVSRLDKQPNPAYPGLESTTLEFGLIYEYDNPDLEKGLKTSAQVVLSMFGAKPSEIVFSVEETAE